MAFELALIGKAIDVARAEINRKNLSIPEKKRLSALLDLSPSDYAKFQETKSILFAAGKISEETAMFIYQKLGNWSKCDLAEKYVLTELFARLLALKMRISS